MGEATDIEIDYGSEIFHAHGLTVLARNYLDVYPYDKWESSQNLPQYTVGETFEPKEATMHDGETSAPGYLTEPELIALMDANGIGTDATMAEHIAKIKDREYVVSRPKGGGGATDGGNGAGNRGGGGGRGRGRGRGGRGGRGGSATTNTGGGASGGVQEFIPTTLGVALIEGYDNVGIETSLSKPFLRKEGLMQGVVMVLVEAGQHGSKGPNNVIFSSKLLSFFQPSDALMTCVKRRSNQPHLHLRTPQNTWCIAAGHLPRPKFQWTGNFPFTLANRAASSPRGNCLNLDSLLQRTCGSPVIRIAILVAASTMNFIILPAGARLTSFST